jgi:hypothetical protein
MLAIIISCSKEDSQVRGLIPHLVDGGVSILPYTDDTIIFLEHDLEKALNMKLILCIFEHLLGLKINFIIAIYSALEKQRRWKINVETYLVVYPALPFKYLGDIDSFP